MDKCEHNLKGLSIHIMAALGEDRKKETIFEEIIIEEHPNS